MIIDIKQLILQGKIDDNLRLDMSLDELIAKWGEPNEITDFNEFGKLAYYKNVEIFTRLPNDKIDYYKYMFKTKDIFPIVMDEGIDRGEERYIFRNMSLASLFLILQNVKCEWNILNNSGLYDNDFLVIQVNNCTKIWYDLKIKK